MGDRIDVREAEEIAERDSVGKCQTCTGLAEEGDVYCWHCRSYWDDVRNGVFQDDW